MTIEMLFNSPQFLRAQAAVDAQRTGQDYSSLFATYQQRYEIDKYLVFTVSLDTHSANLSAYDMKSIAFLRNDTRAAVSPVRWEQTSGSSPHHRSGRLFFSLQDSGIDLSADSTLEVSIRGLAGVEERVFRWDLPISYPLGL